VGDRRELRASDEAGEVWGAVAVRGGTQRGSREDEGGRSKHRSEQRERGAQQGLRVVATGALAVFTVDPL